MNHSDNSDASMVDIDTLIACVGQGGETGYLAGMEIKRRLRPDDIINTSTASWIAVTLLTSQPNSSVVVAHPGLDYAGDPCATIICRGPWTTDIGLYFTGRDLLDALSSAVLAFTEATRD